MFLCAISAVFASLRANPSCGFSASPRAVGINGVMRRDGSTQSRGDRRGSAEDYFQTGMNSSLDPTWPLGQHISLRNLRGLRVSASQLSLYFSASAMTTGIYGARRRIGRTQSRGDRGGSAEDHFRDE